MLKYLKIISAVLASYRSSRKVETVYFEFDKSTSILSRNNDLDFIIK
jgi:hypothetical protein